ncbi:Autophagy protein 5 [Fasciolopsis buskii]|uniref:Autophagy protein 5 n=1 Tax=Fasciolopsis buskii TaxID=27845 RepID=A0A8E0RNN5_9TREM|nr:Autophagy protein 5 [Fasciolopsis buski]
MSAEDSDVIKRVWEGKLPICFVLAQEDLSNQDRVPSPVYLMVPRLSYFPLVTERVIRHFIGYTDLAPRLPLSQNSRPSQDPPEIGVEVDSQLDSSNPSESDSAKTSEDPSKLPPERQVWLEYANQPLKWHYPVGLLFDLFANGSDIPWKVVVHFTSYPADVLLAPPVDRQAVESHFMSLLKEADALKHRSQVMNQMQARDHQQLWTGLLSHQFDKFWMINRRLMEPLIINPRIDSPQLPSNNAGTYDRDSPVQISDATAAESRSNTPNPDTSSRPVHLTSPVRAFRSIPLRVYRRSVGNFSSPYPSGYIQKRIQPFSNDGTMISIADAMRILLLSPNEGDTDFVLRECNFILHGVHLPPDAPIQWISENMSYADSFLHIVVHSCA